MKIEKYGFNFIIKSQQQQRFPQRWNCEKFSTHPFIIICSLPVWKNFIGIIDGRYDCRRSLWTAAIWLLLASAQFIFIMMLLLSLKISRFSFSTVLKCEKCQKHISPSPRSLLSFIVSCIQYKVAFIFHSYRFSRRVCILHLHFHKSNRFSRIT